jgi:hypothetical protein
MSEAVLILPNMRGGCATVGGTVHTLFRVSGRRARPMARPDHEAELIETGRSGGRTDVVTSPR